MWWIPKIKVKKEERIQNLKGQRNKEDIFYNQNDIVKTKEIKQKRNKENKKDKRHQKEIKIDQSNNKLRQKKSNWQMKSKLKGFILPY